MAWMETDYSKHTHFRWKIKWRLEHLGTLGIMGEKTFKIPFQITSDFKPLISQNYFSVMNHLLAVKFIPI